MWWKLKADSLHDFIFTISNEDYEIDINIMNGRIYAKTPFDNKQCKYVSYRTIGQNLGSFEKFLEKEFTELLL